MDAAELGHVGIFAEASDEDLAQLAQRVEEVWVPAGTVLARTGEFAYRFFGILDGTASVTQAGKHITHLEVGDFFGEVGLVQQQHRRTATVVATSDMRLATMMSWDFREIEERYPSIWARINEVVEERWANVG